MEGEQENIATAFINLRPLSFMFSIASSVKFQSHGDIVGEALVGIVPSTEDFSSSDISNFDIKETMNKNAMTLSTPRDNTSTDGSSNPESLSAMAVGDDVYFLVKIVPAAFVSEYEIEFTFNDSKKPYRQSNDLNYSVVKTSISSELIDKVTAGTLDIRLSSETPFQKVNSSLFKHNNPSSDSIMNDEQQQNLQNELNTLREKLAAHERHEEQLRIESQALSGSSKATLVSQLEAEKKARQELEEQMKKLGSKKTSKACVIL